MKRITGPIHNLKFSCCSCFHLKLREIHSSQISKFCAGKWNILTLKTHYHLKWSVRRVKLWDITPSCVMKDRLTKCFILSPLPHILFIMYLEYYAFFLMLCIIKACKVYELYWSGFKIYTWIRIQYGRTIKAYKQLHEVNSKQPTSSRPSLMLGNMRASWLMIIQFGLWILFTWWVIR